MQRGRGRLQCEVTRRDLMGKGHLSQVLMGGGDRECSRQPVPDVGEEDKRRRQIKEDPVRRPSRWLKSPSRCSARPPSAHAQGLVGRISSQLPVN